MTTKAIKIKIHPENDYAIDCQLQEFTIIDGQETAIGKSWYEPMLYPGDNASAYPDIVNAIINAIHTDTIINAYISKDNPTLAQVKATKIDLIAQQRYLYEISGAEYGEYTLRTDRASVQMLDTYIAKLRAGMVESVRWKCMDNEWLTINSTNADAIEALVFAHVAGAFAKEEAAQEAINLLETVEAVQAYTVEW